MRMELQDKRSRKEMQTDGFRKLLQWFHLTKFKEVFVITPDRRLRRKAQSGIHRFHI